MCLDQLLFQRAKTDALVEIVFELLVPVPQLLQIEAPAAVVLDDSQAALDWQGPDEKYCHHQCNQPEVAREEREAALLVLKADRAEVQMSLQIILQDRCLAIHEQEADYV